MLHQQVLGGFVPEGCNLLLHHHLRHDRMHLLLGQVEHADELAEVEGVVDRHVGEEVRPQGLRLHLLLDHLLHLLPVGRVADINVIPQLQVVDGLAGARPVPLLQGLRRADHGLLVVLGRAHEDLLVVVVQGAAQDLGDDSALARRVDGLQGQVRHLQQHGAEMVRAVQHLEVDVHVVRQLAQTFRPLLLRRPVLEPAEGEALGQ
mmetsp:Transcript_1653/g.4881  ORF Transcript_1653/g.4881 Transcript_1653/m.4881 type:complete len:205 (-) Transcript_1653:1634-2248(-)